MVGAVSSCSSSSIPRWLQILLGEKFFSPCVFHECAKKNEKNIFCLDCSISICLHCVHAHRPHRLLQIRRYVYHDVIRLGDAQKLMNCSFVQPYTTNRAKVIFLHKRPMSRPFKSSGNFCMKCTRSLQHSYLFCSISCKIQCHLATCRSGTIINKSMASPFSDATGKMKSNLLLDSQVSLRAFACPGGAVEPSKRKKRGGVLNPLVSSRQRLSTINRRKSVPHRAPLN